MNEANFICLNVTYNCNCRCDYCFAYDYDVDRSRENCQKLDMTLEEIKTCCEFLAANPSEQLTLGFFGGEPMLRFDLIFETVTWAKSRYKNLKLCITTNSTLINAESAEFFAQHGFNFVLSVDGNEEQHNAHRKTRRVNDGNSFQRTMTGLDCLRSAYKGKVSATLRATFINDSTPDLVSRLQFLNTLVDQGYAKNCSLEPAVDRFLHWTPKEEKKFRVEYAEVTDWWLESWRAKRTCTFHHFDRLLPRFFGFEKANSECGAGRRYLSVGPGGKIYACHRNIAQIGDAIAKTWNNEARDVWKRNTWQECRPTCGECSYHDICGGGCRANAIQMGLPLRQPPVAECALFKLRVDALRGAISRMSEVERIVLRNRAAQRKNSIGKGNQNGGHKGVCRRNVGGENDTASTAPVGACSRDRSPSEHESQ